MTGERVAAVASAIGLVLQPVFLAYFLLYNGYMLLLILLSARQVRRRVAGHFVEDLDLIDDSDYTKPLTMVVPAFNEEVTIVDSVTNLVHCDYPRFEVVVVNDGSSDRTLEALKDAFRLRRTDLPYRDAIGTARVRPRTWPPCRCRRTSPSLLSIHKDNAGKADALNAGINCSTAPYFVSLDADSILDLRASRSSCAWCRRTRGSWRWAARWRSPTAAPSAAAGRRAWASPPTPRFQMVEYLRSFTTGRTGLDRLDSVLILSGVFAVFEKETVIRAGGYLTPLVQHRLVGEYVGDRAGTVCEDMEIVVRLHRFVRDKLRTRRVAFLPHPVAWTEVPERLESLRKQRALVPRPAEFLSSTATCCSGGSTAASAGSRCRRSGCSRYHGPMIEAIGYLFVAAFLVMEWTSRCRSSTSSTPWPSCWPRSAGARWSTSSLCRRRLALPLWLRVPTGCSAACCRSTASATSSSCSATPCWRTSSAPAHAVLAAARPVDAWRGKSGW